MKPKLLYASPFPPMASGISDYSVAVVKALQDIFEITLFTDNYCISDETISHFKILKTSDCEPNFNEYDYLLYNMGNNSEYHSYIYETALLHPGVVILHDFVLFHFALGYYSAKNCLYSGLYTDFGIGDFKKFKNAIKSGSISAEFATSLPLNRVLLESGNRFIVHSDYSRNKILDTGLVDDNQICKINHIDQVEDDATIIPRKELFEKFGIKPDSIVVCAFGYIQETKLNVESCHAIKKLAKETNRDICYVMVGKGDYADNELESERVIKTGYTSIDEFNSFVYHADIILNLRCPSMGETSGAMIRSLKYGKPIITNNGGWFSEIPDECVIKISLDDIENNIAKAILELLNDSQKKQKVCKNAKEYIYTQYSKDAIASQIQKFLITN